MGERESACVYVGLFSVAQRLVLMHGSFRSCSFLLDRFGQILGANINHLYLNMDALHK